MSKVKEIFKYQCSREKWEEFINLWDQKLPILIDYEMYMYWLEVLPPVYMNKKQKVTINDAIFEKNCDFGFAEGFDYVVDFWKVSEDVYCCLKSNRMNNPY